MYLSVTHLLPDSEFRPRKEKELLHYHWVCSLNLVFSCSCCISFYSLCSKHWLHVFPCPRQPAHPYFMHDKSTGSSSVSCQCHLSAIVECDVKWYTNSQPPAYDSSSICVEYTQISLFVCYVFSQWYLLLCQVTLSIITTLHQIFYNNESVLDCKFSWLAFFICSLTFLSVVGLLLVICEWFPMTG